MTRAHGQRANDWTFVDAISRHFVRAGRDVPLNDLMARDAHHRATTAARRQLHAHHRHPQIKIRHRHP